MEFIKGALQVVFFVVFIGAGLAAATIISNGLPMTDPPGLLTRALTYLNTNVAQTTQDSAFPELRMIRYQAPPALLSDVARRAAEALGWEVTETNPQTHAVRAVVTTKLFGFQDDVFIRVYAARPSGSALYIHSSSRVGKGDLGTNTRHVMNLTEAVYQLAPPSSRIRDEEEWSLNEEPGLDATPEAGPQAEEGQGAEQNGQSTEEGES
ncbi:MAG: DUF1499 domain-containing protein [Desulfurellaceae bacterium]|nr:DUF1499 domain-containing protein [Desulfurellaceae bacterium]